MQFRPYDFLTLSLLLHDLLGMLCWKSNTYGLFFPVNIVMLCEVLHYEQSWSCQIVMQFLIIYLTKRRIPGSVKEVRRKEELYIASVVVVLYINIHICECHILKSWRSPLGQAPWSSLKISLLMYITSLYIFEVYINKLIYLLIVIY